MLLIDKIALWNEAERVLGRRAQVDHLLEEMGELIQAINKQKRGSGLEGKADENLIEELGDVRNMVDHIVHMFDIDAQVQARCEYKLQRVAKRLAEAKRRGQAVASN